MEKCLFFFIIFQLLSYFVCPPVESEEYGEAELLHSGWPDEVEDFSEYGEYFEGDMILNEEQLSLIYGERTALKDDKFRWPKAIVPFKFVHDHSLKYKENILKAMKIIEEVSCVRFRQQNNETDYVQFQANNDGCYASVGRQGGKQLINLAQRNPHCMRVGVIMHELLHALGFHHSQSAADRDDYVKINFANIKTNKKKNFRKYNSSSVTDLNLPYDFGSIMHYSPRAFSNDPTTLITIEQIVEDPSLGDQMGQRDGLSDTDVLRVNAMYKCNVKH